MVAPVGTASAWRITWLPVALGTPMDCNSATIKTMGLGFASNLPGFYLDNAYAEQGYNNYVRDASVRKPKGRPTLKPAQKRSKAENVRLRNENAWVGGDEGDPQNPAPTATDRQKDFYKQNKKKLARCIWQVLVAITKEIL
jgi:hypothetical protein